MTKIPNFFIIGSAKSGTTAINDYLDQHPNICMARKKESHYFAFKDMNVSYAGNGDMGASDIVSDEDEYMNLFNNSRKEDFLGESSVFYIFYSYAAKRIYEVSPNAKIVAILRNPVDRAYSNYWYLKGIGREKCASFERALNKESERKEGNWEPIWFYKKLGLYCKQLKPYYDIFAKDQIKVIIYDDFKENPNKILRELHTFVGAPQHDVTSSVHPKKSGRVTNSFIAYLLNNAYIKNILKTIVPTVIWSVMQKKFITKPRMLGTTRNNLINYFTNDIEELEVLIERDLSAWKR
jgi:hypothetical protein